MKKENVFYFLNYTHNELQSLLQKLDNNHMLTENQYYQLVEEIGLDNISTFTGDYEDLINQPNIPTRLSDLFNDMGFISEKDIIYEINDELIPIKENLKEIELIVSALNKLDLDIIADDLAQLQNDLNFLNKMFEELRHLNNSFSSQLESTDSEIKKINNDIDFIISEQNYLSDSIKTVKDNIRSINETKIELTKATNYLKDTIVGEKEYEFEKSIIEVLKETRGNDFIGETKYDENGNLIRATRALDQVDKLLEALIGVGDSIDENTFGVLMQKVNDVPELICVREYIRKIDSIYEQLGKEGLLEFLDDFKIILDSLQRDSDNLKEENEALHTRINDLERLHIQDVTKLNNTLKQYDVSIKALEEKLAVYDVAGLKALANKAISDASRAYNYADSNRKEIVLLSSKIDSLNNLDGLTSLNTKVNNLSTKVDELDIKLNNYILSGPSTGGSPDINIPVLKDEIKTEIKNELKDEIQVELKEEIKIEIKEDIIAELENLPEHILVTEEEYYNNYTEEERNSKDKLFIITEYKDGIDYTPDFDYGDGDGNINIDTSNFLTKDMVANSFTTEYVTREQYDALVLNQQLKSDTIYIIIK